MTNSPKSEAREFILVKEKLSNAALAFDLGSFIPQNWPPASYVDTLYVIEKSAYAYAVDQWDYWVEEARKAQDKHERVLQALQIAESALEKINGSLKIAREGHPIGLTTSQMIKCADEALAQIEKSK